MVSIAALASTQNSIFARPHAVRYACDEIHHLFACPVSDHITNLNALHAYYHTAIDQKVDIEEWCHEMCLNLRVLEEVMRIRKQLIPAAARVLGLTQGQGLKSLDYSDMSWETKIRKALARSFFHNSAIWAAKGPDLYTTVHNNYSAGVSPGSALVGGIHQWVVYDKLCHFGKQYMTNVTSVEVDWLIVRYVLPSCTV